MQKFSYHTHTVFSDGKHSLDEMLQQAVRLGWEEIGISDHLIIHKNIKESPSYPELMQRDGSALYRDDFNKAREVLQRHAEEFRKTAAKYPLKVRLGYETDYFTYDGWEDEFRELIKQIDHDYLITGNHFFASEDGLQVIDIHQYNRVISEDQTAQSQEYLRRHYQTLQKAVKSGLFAFLAHLDYARKLNHHALFPMIEERLRVVRALKEAGVACELSTKGLRKINDFYPENIILCELIKQEVPLVISDDAHQIQELGYGFDKAEEKLSELNCQRRFKMSTDCDLL